MLDKWLAHNNRQASPYTKFRLSDVEEISLPDTSASDDALVLYLAEQLLHAHCNPEIILKDWEILAEDTATINLTELHDYIKENILPRDDRIATRIGNFGEILAAQILIELLGFWLPIYKLRYREKKDWSIRLTDLCLVKKGTAIPLVCYGEVKTRSSNQYDKDVAIKGHESLATDDVFENPEVLQFTCKVLYEASRFDEAVFLTKIRLGKIQYEKMYTLFLLHEESTWNEEILGILESHNIDARLVNFSVHVVLIKRLRELIDKSYELTLKIAEQLIK